MFLQITVPWYSSQSLLHRSEFPETFRLLKVKSDVP